MQGRQLHGKARLSHYEASIGASIDIDIKCMYMSMGARHCKVLKSSRDPRQD